MTGPSAIYTYLKLFHRLGVMIILFISKLCVLRRCALQCTGEPRTKKTNCAAIRSTAQVNQGGATWTLWDRVVAPCLHGKRTKYRAQILHLQLIKGPKGVQSTQQLSTCKKCNWQVALCAQNLPTELYRLKIHSQLGFRFNKTHVAPNS